MICSYYPRVLAIAVLAGLTSLFPGASALADAVGVKVDYTVSISGLPVGKATVDAELKDGNYSISGSGKVAGISAIFTDGKGKASVTGTMLDQVVSPIHYSQVIVEDEKETLDMTFSDGRVTDIAVTPTAEEKRRRRQAERKGKKKRKKKKKNRKVKREIPLLDEHREGVLDPLSAFLLPVENLDGKGVCERRIPVFDGEHRFDIVMTLKKVEKQDGSKVFVCSLAYRPIAGYRPDDK